LGEEEGGETVMVISQWKANLERAREGKDAFFTRQWQSPIPPQDKPRFKGLEYYPPDPGYRFELELHEHREEQAVRMVYTKGNEQDFVLHGFEDDQKVRIIRNAYRALKMGGSFYILDYAEFDIDRMWFPLRWAFTKWECQLAIEFLKLDIKGMLCTQGCTDFKEEFFFRRHLRLLSAVKPLISTI
jgi:hypothetical protein